VNARGDDALAAPAGRDPLAVMDRNRSLLSQAQGYIYKEFGGSELEVYVFTPEDHAPGQSRSAILFFHSSAWDSGLVSQFAPHCLHFVQRGIVAMTFEYRVASRHGTGPLEAMADARSAVRWVRAHAMELGIDPEKIIGAGGSGGAFIVLAAAMIIGPFDDATDNPSIPCEPNALVLFDPVVDVSSRSGFCVERFPDAATAHAVSPMHAIRSRLPPMILFQGTQDRLIPVETTRKFVNKMSRWPRRNICEFVPFDGCGHSFFNFNVDPRYFEATINLADRFLVTHGFLPPDVREETDDRLQR
jgi:acetyl esterase/lipase